VERIKGQLQERQARIPPLRTANVCTRARPMSMSVRACTRTRGATPPRSILYTLYCGATPPRRGAHSQSYHITCIPRAYVRVSVGRVGGSLSLSCRALCFSLHYTQAERTAPPSALGIGARRSASARSERRASRAASDPVAIKMATWKARGCHRQLSPGRAIPPRRPPCRRLVAASRPAGRRS